MMGSMSARGTALPRRLAALALTVVATLALAACTGDNGDSGTAGDVLRFAPDKRSAAPEVSGELLDGGSYDLAQHKGSVIVINFWASWCAPCRLEAAGLETVHKATSADGVKFVGIDSRDDRDKAAAFVSERNSYPSIFDPAGRLALRFTDVPPITIPSTLVIDRQGRIAAVLRKAVSADELSAIVQEITAERAS